MTTQANPLLTVDWICTDGTFITINAEQIIGFAVVLQEFDLPIYNHAKGLIQQVKGAASVDAVREIPTW